MVDRLYAKHQSCLDCETEYPIDSTIFRCNKCGGCLEVKYDYDEMEKKIAKEDLKNSPERSLWRYAKFLPVESKHIVSLGEGMTPLIIAKNLSVQTGSNNILLKLDFCNPTGSFKDRGTSVLISNAKKLHVKEVAIDSSGNNASSISAYSARAGIKCYVFSPSYASRGKLVQSMAYGSRLFGVEGTRHETYQTAYSAVEFFGWYYCGSTNAFPIEGSKTLAYEICESLGWKPPSWIVIPTGGGTNLIGCYKGLKELMMMGWIEKIPSLVCAQSDGCAPIVKSLEKGRDYVEPVEKASGIAEGLMIRHPQRGDTVLKILKETNGLAISVSDDEIVEAIKQLSKLEGIYIEPSSAVALAALNELRNIEKIDRNERVVCELTGSGLKTSKFYNNMYSTLTKIKPGIEDLKTRLKM